MTVHQLTPTATPDTAQTHTVRTDMPAGLTHDETRAYVRGYSKGALAYARKHGGGGVTVTGEARASAAELSAAMRAHEAERHPSAHRAGLSALRAWVRQYAPDRLPAVAAAVKGDAPVKSTSTTRKARTTSTTRKSTSTPTPTEKEPTAMPTPLAIAPAPTATPAASTDRPVYRTRKVQRRELAAALRARGISPTGDAWEQAKRDAGLA
jgi:hypothetical protein